MISTKSFCQYFYRFRIISNQEEIFTLWKVSKTYWMSFNTKVNNFWKSSIQKGVYSSGHVPCFEMETWTRTHFKSHKALAMNLLWTKKKKQYAMHWRSSLSNQHIFSEQLPTCSCSSNVFVKKKNCSRFYDVCSICLI